MIQNDRNWTEENLKLTKLFMQITAPALRKKMLDYAEKLLNEQRQMNDSDTPSQK